MSPSDKLGPSTLSKKTRKDSPFIGPSRTHGATRPSQRRPAVKVVVFQCPQGALPISRWPRRQRPWVRTILVEVPVSSTNTRRVVSSSVWLAFQRCRASATSGRSCSAACRVFFEGDFVPLEKAVDRAVRGAVPTILQQPLHDLRQGQVSLPANHLQQPRRMRLQQRAALGAPATWAHAAGLVMPLHPPDGRRSAPREPIPSRSPRQAPRPP